MSSILDDDVKNQVTDFLSVMKDAVEVLFFGSQVQKCDYCGETRQLLEEVSLLSEKISLSIYDIEADPAIAGQYGIERVPTFLIGKREGNDITDFGIRFVGIPAGHEFTSLIKGLVLVSKGETHISEEGKTTLAEIGEPVLLQVFVTPT